MSIRVYGWQKNPAVDHYCYRLSDCRGQHLLETLAAIEILDGDGRRAIQLLAPREVQIEQTPGIGNLIPFGRLRNPLLTPDKLHYEIPMAGDRTCRARHRRRRIRVSCRSKFSKQRIANCA